ncbi:hypothetical protein QVD17_30262 [Tagetes erecta]|uniref:Uncharacterized protein n=1 Tax=Tagetes erecta TaxID=13708 RepID=A0AAD8K3U6_TARER|nr:hypothetical protein QVD17_30262 [Tagetes erecta]
MTEQYYLHVGFCSYAPSSESSVAILAYAALIAIDLHCRRSHHRASLIVLHILFLHRGFLKYLVVIY